MSFPVLVQEVDGGLDHFYLDNLWMTFPPEAPQLATHLPLQPREQRCPAPDSLTLTLPLTLPLFLTLTLSLPLTLTLR